MAEGLDSVSTYLATVRAGKSEQEENTGPLTRQEQAVLKQLLDPPAQPLRTAELLAATGLGVVELAQAVDHLRGQGVIEVDGRGADEVVSMATKEG